MYGVLKNKNDYYHIEHDDVYMSIIMKMIKNGKPEEVKTIVMDYIDVKISI